EFAINFTDLVNLLLTCNHGIQTPNRRETGGLVVGRLAASERGVTQNGLGDADMLGDEESDVGGCAVTEQVGRYRPTQMPHRCRADARRDGVRLQRPASPSDPQPACVTSLCPAQQNRADLFDIDLEGPGQPVWEMEVHGAA